MIRGNRGDPIVYDHDECFEALIQQLRVEGYSEVADRMDMLLHHTAWTTGSELLGELGLAILAFKQQKPAASAVLRQQLKTCLRAVRRVWPGLKKLSGK